MNDSHVIKGELEETNIPLLSLCIPTNGIIELIFPVLDSIYSQQIESDLYEVVVMDNGDNKKFHKMILDYASTRPNLHYYHTEKKLFLNEPESYKVAKGKFIKFVSHRTKLVPGALKHLIEFVSDNQEEKPFVYFLDGVIKDRPNIQIFNSFDSFVSGLSYWSSWSTGMGFWKSDFESLPENIKYNELFPHTTILFSQRKKEQYIIDNTYLLDEMQIDHGKKGKYDLYYAFSVEYISILLDLVRSGDISLSTFLKLKEDNLGFITDLYYKFNIKHEPHSYDISHFEQCINVYYSYRDVIRKLAEKGSQKAIHIFKKGGK